MSKPRILAISSSKVGDKPYLSAFLPMIKDFLGDKVKNIALVPYAGVSVSYDDYVKKVSEAASSLGYQWTGIHQGDAKKIIEQSDAIVTPGGNTFHLLKELYDNDVLDLIRNKVKNGTPYIGWSAGSNIMGLSLCTTNDMPIVEPRSFKAIGLLPFQINAHYASFKVPGHNGETRDDRLNEFIIANPKTPIVCIPEGTAILCEGSQLLLQGEFAGVLMGGGHTRRDIAIGEDISFLLE